MVIIGFQKHEFKSMIVIMISYKLGNDIFVHYHILNPSNQLFEVVVQNFWSSLNLSWMH